MMRKRGKRVNASDLNLVRSAPPPLPLRIGDRVRLNSGGPVGLVVDLPDGHLVTVSWGSGETTLPKSCFKDA